MIERTLCIIKPDVALTLGSHVIISLLADGFSVIDLHRGLLTKAQVEKLYAAHVGQPYYQRNLEFMLSDVVVVMVLEGLNAIERLRNRVGPTDPQEARRTQKGTQKWTLRALYGTELPRNAVHASGNEAEAKRELYIFFPGRV